MKLTTAQKWRHTIAWLKRNFPARKSVYVKSKLIKKVQGYTELHGSWFYIAISRKASLGLRLDTLIHEWAHCLTWFGAEETADHSAEWGIAYAKIYRTWLKWNYGQKQRGEDE